MSDKKISDRQGRKKDEARSGGHPASSAEGEMGGATERIAKRLARAGVASRRDAEAMIAAGRVSVNGKVLASPAVNVGPRDTIEVDGAALPAIERTRLFLFHKPAGLVTTNRDPQGRQTVFDVLPKDLPRLITVGRLDLNTEGLLLLTNDGGLARVLELPSTGWLRRYRVRVHGKVDLQALEGLKEGIAVDGVFYGAIEAALDRVQGSNAWLTIGLREGKNREVRNVLGALNLDVTRLIRISYGPFQLGDLAEGVVQEIKGRTLRDQLGERLIREAGADFDAPVAKSFAGKKPRDASGGEKPGRPGKRTETRGAREERGRAAPGEKRPWRPDRQQKRDAALERLDTRAERHPKAAPAQKRDEPLARRRASKGEKRQPARPGNPRSKGPRKGPRS
jgi:23S rRNA pseudouridine2605 synthase